MDWFRRIIRGLFGWRLKRGPVPSFLRLGTSRHLGDYQFIALGAFVLTALALVSLGTHTDLESSIEHGVAALTGVALHHPIPGAVIIGMATVVATLSSWVYQSASKRLGTIDLFACEINALCRVCLVTDFAEKSVSWLRDWPAKGTRKPTPIDIKEEFTPVYSKNASELQSLDANALTSITSFYTYRMTMIEYLRGAMSAPKWEATHERVEQMIYMQFLMYENARLATEQLTEFEPERAQNLVSIYCSELPLIACLIGLYRERKESRFLYERLRMRIDDYDTQVQALLSEVQGKGEHSDKRRLDVAWIKAKTTAEELERRFAEFQLATRQDKPRHPRTFSWEEIAVPTPVMSAKHAAKNGHANGRGIGMPPRGPRLAHPEGGRS
jgi:hypothetical protein